MVRLKLGKIHHTSFSTLVQLGLPKMQELAAWMESEKDKCEVRILFLCFGLQGDMLAHTLGSRSRQVLSVMTKLAKQIQGYPKVRTRSHTPDRHRMGD